MRHPKPWRFRDQWVSKIDGKRVPLCPTAQPRSDAEKILRELLVKRDQQPKTVIAHNLTFGELLEKFLDFCQTDRAPTTYRNHRDVLKSFAEKCRHVPVRQLTYDHGHSHKKAILDASKCPNHFIVSINAEFPVGARRPNKRNDQRATLRKLGRTGRLVTVYLPAKLGEPAACKLPNGRQHQLLQAIVRETTRATRKPRQFLTESEVIAGDGVKDFEGWKLLHCPHLHPSGQYVGFNGNGFRRGAGYRLLSPGGWLAKAGYRPDAVHVFLDDLAGAGASCHSSLAPRSRVSNGSPSRRCDRPMRCWRPGGHGGPAREWPSSWGR